MSHAISRRALLTFGAAGAMALAMRLRDASAANAWKGYDAAIVIDGLGGPGDGNSDPGAPYTAAHMKDVRDSGVTCRKVARPSSCGRWSSRCPNARRRCGSPFE